MDRAALVSCGMLDAGAPPPVPREAPYRNPRLARGGPIGELVETWSDLATGKIVPVGGRMPAAVRAAFASCAAELQDRISTLRKGMW
jgi:hypothetical protein